MRNKEKMFDALLEEFKEIEPDNKVDSDQAKIEEIESHIMEKIEKRISEIEARFDKPEDPAPVIDNAAKDDINNTIDQKGDQEDGDNQG